MRTQGLGNSVSRQQGAVLIVALLILLVLTMLGVMGLSNMTLEERMAAGYQQMETTFDASQSTINTVVFNSTQFRQTANGTIDCGKANACSTRYNDSIDDPTLDPASVLGAGLNDGRNVPVDPGTNCYFNYKARNTNVGTGTSALSSGTSLQSDVWVTTAGPGTANEISGYEIGEGSPFGSQSYDITAETQYRSAGITTAVSSQTQRIVKLTAGGTSAECNKSIDLKDRTYPIR